MTWVERPYIADTAVEPVPQSVREKADDDAYADDALTMVTLLQVQLQQAGRAKTYASVIRVLNIGAQLSTDQYLEDFRERWGDQQVFRCLARALESPVPVEG